jgi:hypothetical protein
VSFLFIFILAFDLENNLIAFWDAQVSTTIICSTMIEGEQYSMALGSVLVGVIRSDEFFNCIAI